MNLKAKRTAAGLTQSALAKKVGVHKQQIYNFESGVAVPLKHAGKMAKALKISEKELVRFIVNRKVKNG